MSDTTKESIEAFAKANGLTVESIFVPWSQSRNFDPKIKDPLKRSLNWKVTLKRAGRDVLTCDYSAGIAHAPCYKSTRRQPSGGITLYDEQLFIGETETGFAYNTVTRNSGSRKPLKPETADVLYSLANDSDVLDYSSFENWSSELGYDCDSRTAEKIYRECLTHALALRNGLGETLFAQLRDAVSGY